MTTSIEPLPLLEFQDIDLQVQRLSSRDSGDALSISSGLDGPPYRKAGGFIFTRSIGGAPQRRACSVIVEVGSGRSGDQALRPGPERQASERAQAPPEGRKVRSLRGRAS